MLGITGLGFEQKASRVQSYARKERRREEKIGSGTIKRRDVDGDSGGEDSGQAVDSTVATELKMPSKGKKVTMMDGGEEVAMSR
ncbi:hypothetical protein F9C07_2895 [Aspergillus flavus]|uniref:Uncharacterized protein n=1 Tax=Aspergillus flavus (strain ATCC 200026 / FGSC A1120 / IAM 13836 / NRRL 3357 / JCM 12722 / SRRC 167) TaxID=332952 RepID=A0A7U2MEB4_ASPFN|nr:hypothetical protein F9C07_2895 [Aspergillus flavus]